MEKDIGQIYCNVLFASVSKMLLLSKLSILMALLKYCQRSLCCSWKHLRILPRPGLLLDVSIPQGPELHLDLSSLQWPALQLDMDCGGLCCVASIDVSTVRKFDGWIQRDQ
jgi:hypothetical protein